ncbi:MAG: YfhO family protein [Candidatus Hydrogenedentes bacterium]|nr:YfhO family protein [Candidatus Hydrogenedentota bacterium]
MARKKRERQPRLWDKIVWPQKVRWNLLLLALLSVLFFREVFLHPTQMLWANDIVRAHSSYRAAQWHSFWDWGAFPLWDPTVFCGKSIVGDPLPALLNPLGFVFWLTPDPRLFGLLLCIYVTLGAWGTFLFCRRLGCDAAGAFLAAAAFAFSGKIGAHIFAGHVEVLSTMLGFPWILWAAEGLLKQKRIQDVAALGLTLAFVAAMGSVQVVYWHVLAVTVYVCLRLLRGKLLDREHVGIRPFVLYGASLVLFALVGAPWWFPIVRQTLLLSARGETVTYEFATMNSVAPWELVRLIWPNWGTPHAEPFQNDAQMGFFWESASYPGVVTLCFALAALAVLWRKPGVLEFGVLALIALVLALGRHSPLYWLAYELVPGFALFRAPGRLLFYTVFSFAVLAGLALSNAEARRVKVAIAAAICVVGEAVLIIPIAVQSSLRGSPVSLLWLPLLLCVLLGVLAFFWAFQRVPTGVWQIACVVTLVAEFLVYWAPLVTAVPVEKALPPSGVAEFLAGQRAKEEFRILDTAGILPQQIAARYGIETVTGYHPGIYGHYLDLYKKIWFQDDSDIVELLVHPPNEIACPTVLDLMNVRYIITSQILTSGGYTEAYRTTPEESERIQFVYRRESALPRAFLVAKAVEPSPGITVVDQVCQIDPRQECLVSEDPVDGTAKFQELDVKRTSPGDFRLEFEADAPGVVVLSQAWHPDWRATDGGKPVQVRRVNHAQAGVPVEAGKHQLRVFYFPWDFYLGLGVSALAFATVVACEIILIRARKTTHAH